MTDVTEGNRSFFISFNHIDRSWATWIAWALEENGYSVFFQDWDFRGNFVEHMNWAHAEADRTLAVLSDNYFGSDFTLAEWSARFAQDPAARDDRLVPVKVGPLTAETIIASMVYADLTGCDEAEARRRLLGRVKKAVDASYRDKPTVQPGFPGVPDRQVLERPRFPPAERPTTRKQVAAHIINLQTSVAAEKIDNQTTLATTKQGNYILTFGSPNAGKTIFITF